MIRLRYKKFVIRFFILFVIGLVVITTDLFARSRTDIIQEAVQYKDYPWNCSNSNIKDVIKWEWDENGQKWKQLPGSNGYDDRGEYIDEVDGEQVWAYSTKLWPFVVGDNINGVAYAWGYWDTIGSFETKIKSTTEKWIAGRKDGDTDPLTGYGEDNCSYAGLDCSGFISRVWNLSQKHSTRGSPYLTEKGYQTDKANLQSGDIFYLNGSHVVLFVDWINKPYTAKIIHASYTNNISGQKVYRVNEDIATVSGSWVNGTLNALSYTAYTPFPIFSGKYPVNGSDVNTSTPIISITIKSKTSLSGGEGFVKMFLNETEVSLTPTGTNSETGITYKYQPVGANKLTDGDYTVKVWAKNSIGLFEETQWHFFVSNGGGGTDPDTTGPYGWVKINYGEAYTNKVGVYLTLYAEDVSGIYKMRIANVPSELLNAGWINYVTSKDWTLSAVDGEKTVYVQFKDNKENTSPTYSDTIILDTIPPKGNKGTDGGLPPIVYSVGDYPLKVYLSEKIKETPSLSFTPQGKSAIVIQLEKVNDTTYSGSVHIDATTGNGTAVFSIESTDLAENTGIEITPDSFVIDIDTITDRVPLTVVSPINDLWTKDSLVTISGTTAVDATIYVNDGEGIISGDGTFSTTYNLTAEGEKTIIIKASHPDFEEDATATRVVFKDTSPPSLTRIDTNAIGQLATISVLASDTASGATDVIGIKTITVTSASGALLGSIISAANSSSRYPASLPFVTPVFTLPGGENTVTVTAWDGLDNEKTENVPVIIEMPIGSTVTVNDKGDNFGKSITIYSPYQQTFKIEGTGIPGTILTFRITIDGQSYEVTATVGPDGKEIECNTV